MMDRVAWELGEPRRELELALANYLEKATAHVKPGEELKLPPVDDWGIPKNDLMNVDVADMAGQAGFHIEFDETGPIFYRSEETSAV